jgi:hypothetical protein
VLFNKASAEEGNGPKTEELATDLNNYIRSLDSEKRTNSKIIRISYKLDQFTRDLRQYASVLM